MPALVVHPGWTPRGCTAPVGISAAQGRLGRGWDCHAQGLVPPSGTVAPVATGNQRPRLRSHTPPSSGAGAGSASGAALS